MENKKKVGAGFGVIPERDGEILLGKRHPDPDKADSAFFIFFFFSFIMPKRTKEGVDLYLEGLKEYMVTTEKERQIFCEEENIFEKFLPYTIIFKITKKWAKKMEDIYKDKRGGTHAPLWWYGGSFQYNNLTSLTNSLNSLSSQISSSSGAGAGGGTEVAEEGDGRFKN